MLGLPSPYIAVAPMMQWTDRHCRYWLRLIASKVWLYTEMVPSAALAKGRRYDLLAYHPAEHPLALQLGGSDPGELAECAKIAEDAGYAEINLNIGCPSPRVSSGQFGACLFKKPALVAACVQAMRQVVRMPITIKTRIGVDELDSYECLRDFVRGVSEAGCQTFIIHARKAWLQGLSPKENRSIPPLCYEWVYQLKQDFPQLGVILNGGIDNLLGIEQALQQVDGVMIGRAAYYNPYFLGEIERQFFPRSSKQVKSARELVEAYLPYVEEELRRGTPLARMGRHLLTAFQGCPGARAWRRHLSTHMHRAKAGVEMLQQGLELLKAGEMGA